MEHGSPFENQLFGTTASCGFDPLPSIAICVDDPSERVDPEDDAQRSWHQGLHQQIVNVDINAKLRSGCHAI
jgi:hypothetical protein